MGVQSKGNEEKDKKCANKKYTYDLILLFQVGISAFSDMTGYRNHFFVPLRRLHDLFVELFVHKKGKQCANRCNPPQFGY